MRRVQEMGVGPRGASAEEHGEVSDSGTPSSPGSQFRPVPVPKRGARDASTLAHGTVRLGVSGIIRKGPSLACPFSTRGRAGEPPDASQTPLLSSLQG